MEILVTGGLGYIGAHTIIELSKIKCKIVVVDNLSNSKIERLNKIKSIIKKNIDFFETDVSDYKAMEYIFSLYKFDAIIHFAGFKAVGESVEKPLLYYKNNIFSTIILAELALKFHVKHFIFSSSATVYGNQVSPLFETMELKHTTNPYGESKAISERILSDVAKTYTNFKVTLLRYFNPVGAHVSGLIGDDPVGIPNNLMPYITKVAKGELKELKIFGNDYDTPDGTGIRDYIHVVDLAKGHIAALKFSKSNINIYNLGTGRGLSVLEIIAAFEKVNKIKIPLRFVKRRQGDLDRVYADVSKARKELFWEAELSVEDMVKDAWNYEKKLGDNNV